MKSKRLTIEESRKLVWLTWFEFLIAGVVVYFFTDPVRIPVLLAGPILLHALINFWVKSEGIPVKIHSVVPTVFMPTAFLMACSALVYALIAGKIMNSVTLALATICVVCIMASYPESGYADYD